MSSDDFALCQDLLSRAQYDHLAVHLPRALKEAPHDARWLALVARAAAALGDDAPDTLAPLTEGGTPFDVVALRSELAAGLGSFLAAISLLTAVLEGAHEDIDYAPWLSRWTSDSRFKRDADELRALTRVLRLAGEKQEALAVAQELLAIDPEDYSSWTLSYGALRELGRFPAALAAIDMAIRHAPDKHAASFVWLDKGDLHVHCEEWDEARAAYGEVLRDDESHAWAHPSSLYCERMLGRDEDDALLAELEGLAADGNRRAEILLEEYAPFSFRPFPPYGEIVGLVKTVIEEGPPREEPAAVPDGLIVVASTRDPHVLRFTVSRPEPPSALFASVAELARCKLPYKLVVPFERIPTPDPRLATRELGYDVWVLEDGQMTTPLGEPPEEIASRIAGIAALPYSMTSWKHIIKHACKSDLKDVDAAELLATMVNIPDNETEFDGWEWTIRVQTACALALALLPEEATWEESNGREALLSLLDGPEDWAGAAAALALTETAPAAPDLIEDIASNLLKRLRGLPVAGGSCLEEPLVRCLLRLPSLTNAVREELGARRAAQA